MKESLSSRAPSLVLYHHRTQGKAVEGVHIRGVVDALRSIGTEVVVHSLPGADPYSTPKAMSPTRQATTFMKLVSKLPQPMFELAEIAYNLRIGVRTFWWLLRNKRTDFIYERYALFTFMTTAVARLFGKPIILEINDSCTVDRVRPLYFQKIARWLERWTFRKASGLIFVSERFRRHVAAAHGHMAPSIVSQNAANIADFSFTAEDRNAGRAAAGFQNKVVCGYLGAFVPWHAIDKFVYAIADRLEQSPDLCLLLIGDGATFDTVKEFVVKRGLSHRIHLTGRVPHKEVPKLLAAMDMAVLPSAGDYTSPVKLFEFMACGIPPVAPDLEPIQEILREDDTGWMFKAYDTEAAVRCVLQKAADPQALARVGKAARAYIAAERQWVDNIDQLVTLVSEVRRSPAG